MSLNINNAQSSNMTSVVTDVTVDSKNLDGVSDQKETEWQNTKWSQQWGYFNEIPDLKTALILKTIWNVGNGYTCSAHDKVLLDHITGWGKDSFHDILFNMVLVSMIGGDSYAEIIKDPQTDRIVNIKPLDPGSIKIIVDGKGLIKRYEQSSKTGSSSIPKKWEPEEILHICHDRFADQIHGISCIDVLEKKILAEYESFIDTKKIVHRNARPLIMFKLKTDNTAKIAAFVAKMDKATNEGENIYIPDDENIVSYEVVQVNPSDFVLAWRDSLRNDFFRAIGMPQIVPGGGGQTTESEAKTIYLAFEQIVRYNQTRIELQLLKQLNIELELKEPSSMLPNLQTDTVKDGAMSATQPNDFNAQGND